MATEQPGLLENLKVNVSDLANFQLPKKLPISNEIKYIDRVTTQLIDQTPWVVLKVGVGITLIIAGWMLSGWLAGKLNRILSRAHVEETLAAFLASTTRFLLFFNVFIVAMTIIGVSSTSLAALLGAIGLAAGFALRTTFGSIAGGILLMVHRPLKVGDWIEITTPHGSPAGTVKRIGLFSTEVNTREFVRVFIPNSMLWESVLRNDTYNRMRMVKLDFGLGHEVNVKAAFEVIMTALKGSPLVLKSPEPVLAVESLTEHGVMCSAEVWARTEDRKALRNGGLVIIMEALEAKGMRMAYQDKADSQTAGHKERTKEAAAMVAVPQKGDKLKPIDNIKKG